MAQRSKRMRNKKTQKQGRSKRGGVDVKGISKSFALVYLLSLGARTFKMLNSQRQGPSNLQVSLQEGMPYQLASEVSSNSLVSSQGVSDSLVSSQGPSNSLASSQVATVSSALSHILPEIIFLTTEEFKEIIESVPMSVEEMGRVKSRIPVDNTMLNLNGEVVNVPGLLKELGVTGQIVFIEGFNPELGSLILGLPFTLPIVQSSYGSRMEEQPIMQTALFGNRKGRYGAFIPIYGGFGDTTVTKDTILNTVHKTLEYHTNPFSSSPYELLSEGGGSRKKRPKTKRRSKRY